MLSKEGSAVEMAAVAPRIARSATIIFHALSLKAPKNWAVRSHFKGGCRPVFCIFPSYVVSFEKSGPRQSPGNRLSFSYYIFVLLAKYINYFDTVAS